MGIKILDPELIQQIAAGEVVEDPSSVIKELIENSIDAEANKIFIQLENGGKDLIRVSDDGVGMDPRDAVLSVKRHATSKIDSVGDLFNIKSLGFRGEALASISSVSRFEIITKTEETDEGMRIKLEGGSKETIEKVASTGGTTVVVKDLFFNTPARRKHLKMASTEMTKVMDIITRYAISNPLIYFRVEHSGKTVLNSPNTASLFNNIVDIYGKSIAKELLEVDYDDQHHSIRGYISKPSVSRADKNNVSIFINRRYIKNKVVSDALYDAYHTLLHHQRFPFAVIMIKVEPKKLDVNIHPAKTKVKVEQEGKLYELIFDVVRKTLQGNNLIPEADVSLNRMSQASITNNIKKDNMATEADVGATFSRKYPLEKAKQASLKDISDNADSAVFSGGDIEDMEITPQKDNFQQEDQNTERTASPRQEEQLPKEQQTKDREAIVRRADMQGAPEKDGLKFVVLGQLYKTYIVAESKEGMMLVDQHAAHERVNFERLMKDYTENKHIKKQSLLQPIKLDLNPKDKSILEDKKDVIKELGFELEDFGSGSYVLRSIPVVIGKQQEKTILLDVLDELISFNKSKSLDAVKEKILSTVACRSAIKAGDTLTPERMNSLLSELFECDFGSSCPHGRPTIINITIEELERRFKRRGF